jgi:hypothetical protein
MINWNDVEVEQEIAQERYEVIVRGRQPAQSGQQEIPTGRSVRFRDWLGDHIINWGCQVKARCQAA